MANQLLISVIFQLGPEYPARKDSQRKESDLQERFGCTGAHRVWRYKAWNEEKSLLGHYFKPFQQISRPWTLKRWRSQKSCKSFFNLKICYKLYLNVPKMFFKNTCLHLKALKPTLGWWFEGSPWFGIPETTLQTLMTTPGSSARRRGWHGFCLHEDR